MDTYRIYDRTVENGIAGTVAPELFAQEGRCWRMVYENSEGALHGAGRMGRTVEILEGLDEGVVAERHAENLVGV